MWHSWANVFKKDHWEFRKYLARAKRLHTNAISVSRWSISLVQLHCSLNIVNGTGSGLQILCSKMSSIRSYLTEILHPWWSELKHLKGLRMKPNTWMRELCEGKGPVEVAPHRYNYPTRSRLWKLGMISCWFFCVQLTPVIVKHWCTI